MLAGINVVVLWLSSLVYLGMNHHIWRRGKAEFKPWKTRTDGHILEHTDRFTSIQQCGRASYTCTTMVNLERRIQIVRDCLRNQQPNTKEGASIFTLPGPKSETFLIPQFLLTNEAKRRITRKLWTAYLNISNREKTRRWQDRHFSQLNQLPEKQLTISSHACRN